MQETNKDDNNHPPAAYTKLAQFGEMLGRSQKEISADQELASLEGAPLDAVSRLDDGNWITAETIARRLDEWLSKRERE